MVIPSGDKENDTDYWSGFFLDCNEDRLKNLSKATGQIEAILKESNKCNLQFVIPLDY